MKNSDCLIWSFAVLKYTGVWFPEGLDPKRNLLLRLYGVTLQTFTFFFMVLAEIVFVWKVSHDTEKTVDAAVLLLSHLVQIVKLFVIWLRQDRIKRLIHYLDGPNFTKEEPSKREIIEGKIRTTTYLGQMFLVAPAITCCFWCLGPFLKSELTLPLKVALPIDISSTQIFILAYVLASISVSMVGMSDAAMNFVFAALTNLAVGQLEVLKMELDKVSSIKKAVYKDVVSCIKYHQHIIAFSTELTSIFGVTIFCQFLTTSGIVCMTAFKITITAEPLEIVTVIFYLLCVLLELLFYCYPGELLKNKSLLVSEAAYPLDWSGDNRCRRALLLVSLRAQKPLEVVGGGIYYASLSTAAKVVQTSYSYYAVLSQKANN